MFKNRKQKGFGKFDMAGYWQRRYRGHGEDEGWYLLTNSGTLKEAVATFKCRSGIEAMFKDCCKTGGYNFEKSHASTEGLKTLILLIALAYSCATLQGKEIQKMGSQKYVARLKEVKRTIRRHSSFWMGLYGHSWVIGIEGCELDFGQKEGNGEGLCALLGEEQRKKRLEPMRD